MGEHNHQVLSECLGLSEGEIDELEQAGVLIQKPS